MKPESSDWQLLREYVNAGSQESFAALVERHVNFVYSTCLREVRDAALAEDSTQVVFLILARKAPLLRESGTLSGWLFKTSRFASRNAMNQEFRRQRREQNVMQQIAAETMAEVCPPSGEGRAQLEERLHDAILSLNAAQRSVILLRYFEGKSVRETGEALGITEKAAERRIAYALEKMRRYFARHGYAVSIAALAAFISSDAVQAAPAACAATVLQMAHSVAAGGAVVGAASATLSGTSASAHVVSLSQGVLKAMLISQIKTGVVASIGFSVMVASTVKLAQFALASQQKTAPASAIRVFLAKKVKPRPILRSAPLKTAAQTAKKQTASQIPQSRPPRSLIRIAQPALPLTPPIAPEIKPEAPKTVIQTIPAELRLRAGEIMLEGKISAVGVRLLTVDVSSYTLPGGKTSVLNPAKAKIVLINEKTIVRVRGQERQLPIGDLKIGVAVQVVGADKGTGEPLTARDIAVWDGVKDGVYQWGTPPQPEVTTPEVADLADVPPDDVKSERTNWFPQGDFQKAAVGKAPFGWTVNPGVRARVVAKNGKSWLAISNANANAWGTMRITVPLMPEMKRVRVTAQLKAKNLVPGRVWWNTARLDFNLVDAKNNTVKWGRGLNLQESGGWTKISNSVEVPPGAIQLVLEAGLFFSTGELLLDNIRVEANAPIDARPLLPGFPEGKFENVPRTGWPQGFEPWEPDTFKMIEENGNHFVRFVSKQLGQVLSLDGRFSLPPDWKRVRVKAKMRVANYRRGKESWETARINLSVEDEMGKQIGDYLKALEAVPGDGWVQVDEASSIPAGAKLLRVQPQIMGASGTLDVDDIEITDATNEALPAIPITPDLPAGTFERLDANGWPEGWTRVLGNPENFTVGLEDGNHFFRLTNGKLNFLAAEARFKVPKEWRAVTIIGRLRMKDYAVKPNAKEWETARVGVAFGTLNGERAGDFQPSLSIRGDGNWRTISLSVDIPRNADNITLSAVMHDTKGIFDVDDLKLEQATPTVNLAPIYEWTREFPEGTFEHLDEQGNALNWPADGKGKVLEEDGNHFLRLSNNGLQSSVSMASQWKLKPQWKAVRVRARIRGRNLKFSGNPLDGARMQIVFLNGQDGLVMPLPAPLELKKDSDWLDLQTKLVIPPGAVTIRLMPSLSRTSGTLDVDDVLIEPADE